MASCCEITKTDLIPLMYIIILECEFAVKLVMTTVLYCPISMM